MSSGRHHRVEVPPEAAGRAHPAERVGEERAAEILERAAALDARRNSEIEIDQLREAAAAAGISRDAFDQAMREVRDDSAGVDAAGRSLEPVAPLRGRQERTLGTADVAYYAALLRDVLGDEGRVTVAEGCIAWSDEEGLTVSVNPSVSGTTAAITAEGRLRRRALAILLPALLPLLVTFMIMLEEGEAALVFFGMLIALAAALVGTAVSHGRERRALRRKAERIRRQLQRLLTPGPNGR